MKAFRSRGVAVLLTLLVGACSGSKSPEGSWVNDTGEEKLDFLDEGELFVTGLDGTFAGTWEVVESGQVKVVFGGRGASFGDQICDFEIERKKLTLSGSCGLQGSYYRQS